MLRTRFEEIVVESAIGKHENPVPLNTLLEKALNEKTVPLSDGEERNLVLAVDIQKDFLDDGALGVPGAARDVSRFTRWLYRNLEKVGAFFISIDTHKPFQIFHPCWWVNDAGGHPGPFTVITRNDIRTGIWRAPYFPEESLRYVSHIEDLGRKMLTVWPYHCIEGTPGHSLENQFMNMVYFHSAVRKCDVRFLYKGSDPLTEMYGIFKPEYSPVINANTGVLDELSRYDRIIVAGEAKSHCVLETVSQVLEHYSGRGGIGPKVIILEDCMSVIPGFEESTAVAFGRFETDYGVKIVDSARFEL